jgi:hypothetical protein
LLVVNLALLSMYVVLSYFEWDRLLALPLVTIINWNPFWTMVWFGGTVPVTIDGYSRIDHWSFVMVLVIIVANLSTIWNIDHVKKN